MGANLTVLLTRKACDGGYVHDWEVAGVNKVFPDVRIIGNYQGGLRLHHASFPHGI